MLCEGVTLVPLSTSTPSCLLLFLFLYLRDRLKIINFETRGNFPSVPWVYTHASRERLRYEGCDVDRKDPSFVMR